MREIKFRAWDTADRKMLDSESVKFFDLLTVNGLGSVYRFMQYIGLIDANDQDIYEGDIVEGYDGIAVIVYDDAPQAGGCFYPDFKNDDSLDWWQDKQRWYQLSIIGNIYENPELLEPIND